MERKKVLIVSDSAKLHTGFACVTREVWSYLNRTGKYDIRQIGWFHQETSEEITWPIITTEKDPATGRPSHEDKYAHKTFPEVVDKFKPDLVWSLGDQWMVEHIAKCQSRKSFKWIMYCPIDGHPSPSKWAPVFYNADVAVLYGRYGLEVIKQRAPKANLTYIYHGVDTKAFHPLSQEEKREAREGLLGVRENYLIIGVVSRNQPRKAFDKLFEAYFYLLGGHYIRCNDCNLVTVFDYDLVTKEFTMKKQCKHCRSNSVKLGSKMDNIKLYVHGAISDCGWDLMDLQTDYNLHGKVLVNPSLRIGAGVPEFALNGIYNSMDIFTLPSRGEGFGLPILEAMSCEIPIVVTDYSAYPEWAKNCGELVPPLTLEAETLTNIRRAIIDIDLYVSSLLKLIEDPELRKKYGKNGREVAKTMDWEIICKQWEILVDSVLYPDGNIPKIEDPRQIKYTLEEI